MKSNFIMLFVVIIFAVDLQNISAQTVSTLADKISIQRIEALSIDNLGNLYTPSGPGSSVYKITPDGNTSLFASGFNFPQGGATDKEGNLYISNWNSGIVTKITPLGKKSVFLSGLKGPTGITFNKDYNEMYVCNYSSNSITKYDISNNTSVILASGNGINGPDGIVFDDNGNLYSANFNDNIINKISSSGEVETFASLPVSSSGYITYAKGNIYVSGHSSNKIFKVSLTGEISVLAGTGSPGLKDGDASQAQFNLPNGITASITGDSIFVCDADNRAIRIIDLSSSTTGSSDSLILPERIKLEQNFPNPFNPVTQITYSLPKAARISLKIFDSVGKEVAVLEEGYKSAGEYKTFFNGISLSSGIYFYSLSAENISKTKKLVLLK